jgi:hypothetical protein
VISQLREGPLPKEKIRSMVSEASKQELLKTLEILQEYNIIQSFYYGNVNLYLLKTDVVLTKNFPQYLKSLLPKETKDYRAQPYSHSNLKLKEKEEKMEEDRNYIEELESASDKIKIPNPQNDFKITKTDESNKEDSQEEGKSEDEEDVHQHKDFIDENDGAKKHISHLQKKLLEKISNEEE